MPSAEVPDIIPITFIVGAVMRDASRKLFLECCQKIKRLKRREVI